LDELLAGLCKLVGAIETGDEWHVILIVALELLLVGDSTSDSLPPLPILLPASFDFCFFKSDNQYSVLHLFNQFL